MIEAEGGSTALAEGMSGKGNTVCSIIRESHCNGSQNGFGSPVRRQMIFSAKGCINSLLCLSTCEASVDLDVRADIWEEV